MKKCIVLVAPKMGEVELQEQDLSDPGPKEIQIRAHRSLVSHGTERAYILKLPSTERIKFPVYPGYASAGVVEAVGKDVTEFKEGDRVASPMSHRSVGNIDVERMGRKLVDEVTFDEATFVALGVTALQGVRKARIEVTESVMVFGLGIVGQLAVQFARINGGLPVIGVDRVQKRLDIALEAGADIVIDTSDESWMETLKAATDGKGAHVVIEASGFPEVITLALQAVRQLGRVVLVGSPRGESTVNFYRDVHCEEVTIIGAHTGGNPQSDSRPGFWTSSDERQSFLTLLAGKRINTEALITERIGIDEIISTYEDMLARRGDVMGTMIEWV